MSKDTRPGQAEFVPQVGSHEDGHEYDSLAELFLGDAPYAPPRVAAGAEGAARVSAMPAVTMRTLADDDADEQPAALREDDSEHGVWMTEPLEDEVGSESKPKDIEAVSENRPHTHVGSERRPTQQIEAVVLGHLPVRASIWVRQHAGDTARELDQPIALLRVGPAMASVELVGPGADRVRTRCETIGDAVSAACAHTSHWIVRVDETTEPGLSDDERVGRVTVLTGADEAAVVASYRLIKSLSASWDKQHGEEHGPKLSAKIMGADDKACISASEKLERAASAFLERPLDITMGQKRVGPSLAATLFRGEPDRTIGQLLQMIRAFEPVQSEPAEPAEPAQPHELRLTTPTPESKETMATTTLATPEPVDTFEHEPMDVEVELEDAPAASPEPDPDPDPEPLMPEPRVVTRPVERVVPRRASPAAVSIETRPAPPSLATLVEGVVALESRCPTVAGVELAADEHGRLHLLAADIGGHEARTIDRLIAGSAWARAHLQLLLRAEPTLGHPSADRDGDHDPVLHVLTTDAKGARPLLDADFRVHLIRRVDVADQSVWVCDELN